MMTSFYVYVCKLEFNVVTNGCAIVGTGVLDCPFVKILADRPGGRSLQISPKFQCVKFQFNTLNAWLCL